jgi:hypothetical protein
MYKLISSQSIYQYFGYDNPDMITSMINIILETNIQELKELSSFYEKDDFISIKKHCHKAKPSMSYIGALGTKKMLEQIELNLETSAKLNIKLQENLKAIEIELRDFLEKL